MLTTSILAISTMLILLISSNELYKSAYQSLYLNIKNTLYISKNQIGQKYFVSDRTEDEKSKSLKTTFIHVKWEPQYRRLFLTAVDTWKFNKFFGNGIKSFRIDCHKLIKQKNTNLTEELLPGKKNRLCSNHPHNYYMEILTEFGIAGLLIISVIAIFFINFVLKNLKYIKGFNSKNFILLSAILSLALETFPLRSTGSLFTTNNSAYVVLIAAIVLCYKKILETKTR